MMEVFVHGHALKHGVAEEDVIYAWGNYLRRRYRDAPSEGQIVAIGVSRKGELIQMIGAIKSDGILIYHALTPPTKKVMSELGLMGR